MIFDLDYIADRSTPEPNSGCWIWLNGVSNDGYAQRGGEMATKVTGWGGKKFKKVSSGKFIGDIAIKTYICNGCEKRYPHKKPDQCECGRLDFTKFDSQGEAFRWGALRLLEMAGKITQLQRQQKYDLNAARIVKDKIIPFKVGEYWADFTYIRDGQLIIEDYKGGAITDMASWKLRHMAAQGLPVKLSTG